MEAAARPADGAGRQAARAPRQLTTTPGAKTHAQFTADSREVFYLEGGRVTIIGVDTPQARPVTVTAEMDVDFQQEKMAVFEQAWAGQRDNFYDAKFHGADWDAVRKTYTPLIEASRTPDEMRRLLRMMVGELNSSHLGVSAPAAGGAPGAGPRTVIGQLGLSFDREEYENNGKLKITGVVPHSPAALAKIQPGEELRAVDGVAIGPRTNLDELLQHKTEKRVTLDIGDRKSERAARRGAGRPDLSQVGGGQSRVRRQGEQREARIRPHSRHERHRADAALSRPRLARTARGTAWWSTSGTTTAASSTPTRSM